MFVVVLGVVVSVIIMVPFSSVFLVIMVPSGNVISTSSPVIGVLLSVVTLILMVTFPTVLLSISTLAIACLVTFNIIFAVFSWYKLSPRYFTFIS